MEKFNFKKSLGQNFLINQDVVDNIVKTKTNFDGT